MERELPSPRVVGLVVAGVVAAVLTLLTLFWPGAFAPTDRFPLAILFGVLAALSLLQARWLRRQRRRSA